MAESGALLDGVTPLACLRSGWRWAFLLMDGF
jgi:hypothetical protein